MREVRYPRRYLTVELPVEWQEDALPTPERPEVLQLGHSEGTGRERLCTQPRIVLDAHHHRGPPSKVTRPLSDFWHLLKRDGKLEALFYGRTPIAGLRDQSRSGREQSLVCKLVWYGFTFEQVNTIMRKARIGKWPRAPHVYRKRTYEWALCL